MSEQHETKIEPALALGGYCVFCKCGKLTGFAHTLSLAQEIGAAHLRGSFHSERELAQRHDDDQRAIDENDEQRDYAEERFNAELMREI